MTFCRVESPTQTTDDAINQVKSGEIWGGIPRGGKWPTVQAYAGSLNYRRGIEFVTTICPEQNGSSPLEARWYLGITPGVVRRSNLKGEDMACITAVVTNLQPVLP
jgi:hypothetical protein